VPVVVRTRDELAKVVALNPLGEVAENHKRYQVSFLLEELDAEIVEHLHGLVVAPKPWSWTVGRSTRGTRGVARSKLWNGLASKSLGVTSTARNWTTVTTLLAMADE